MREVFGGTVSAIRRALGAALVLCLCTSAFGAGAAMPGEKTAAKQQFKVQIPKFKKASDINLPIGQVVQRLPLAVTGNTNLKLYRDSGTEFHSEFTDWNVNWRDKTSFNLKFGWKTQERNAKYALWQVSTVRFPSAMDSWTNPPGLVASGESNVPVGNTASVFYVDLAKFAPTPPDKSKLKSMLSLTQGAKKFPVSLGGSAKGDSQTDTASAAMPGKNLMAIKNMVVPMTTFTFYVRVIPLNSNRQPIGLASNTVHINYGEFEQGPVTIMVVDPSKPYVNPSWPTLVHPTVRIAEYQPIRERQPGAPYHFIAIRDIPGIYKAGQHLDFTPHQEDKSWWDKLGDWISDVVDFVEGAVNWVANAYQSIKEFAVSWAPDFMQGPLMAGLNIGLVAIGIPPEIPDFGELTSMGTDYLVKSAAEYAGLPPEETAKAVNMLVDKAKATENGGGNSAVWLKPDPDYFYRPAYLTVEVTNNTNKVTDRMYLYTYAEPVGDDDAKKYSEPLYHCKCTFVPSMQPGERLEIPVFLEEYTQYRQFDTDIQAGIHRFWIRYHSKPVRIQISTEGERQSQNPYEQQDTVTLEKAYQSYKAL